MASITTLTGSDGVTTANSMTKINTNFTNLNSDKIETSYLDTDTSLTANSDTKIATQKAVKAYVESFQGQTFLVPTGAILPYGGSTAPTNYLLCDGSAVSRSTYANLLAIIGTTFGTGNGSTTFNLPDLRARSPVGAGATTKVMTFASRSSNVITVTGISNIANNENQTGQSILYLAPSGAMTGLTHNTTYYLVRTGNLTFSLASSLANAQNGVVISLSSDGTGVQTFEKAFSDLGLGATGGERNHAMSSTELLAHVHYEQTRTGAGSSNTSIVGGRPDSGGTATSTLGTTSTGGNATMNNMQPFLSLNYIIKT